MHDRDTGADRRTDEASSEVAPSSVAPTRKLPAPPGYELNANGRFVRKQIVRSDPQHTQGLIRSSVIELTKMRDGRAGAAPAGSGGISQPSVPNITARIPLAKIHDSPHARPLNEQHVAALKSSIQELGLLEPIVVRMVEERGTDAPGTAYEIMAGSHRAKACRALGWEAIPATVREADDLHAELILIDENLCRHDLSPAERAKAFKRRKEIYESIHGAAKAKGAHASNAVQGNEHNATANLADAFTADAGKKTGKSERAIQRDIQRAEALGDEVLTKVIGTSLDKGEELDALAKLSEPRREALIARAAAGETVTAKTAVKQERRAEREADLGGRIAAANLELPDRKFGVILADPAWGRTVYNNETGMDRHAANHYPVASGDETNQDDTIKALPVASIAAPDCVLGLWVTDPHRGVDVMRAWGFAPKSYFVWIKDVVLAGDPSDTGMLSAGDRLDVVGAAGTGFWRRDRCELLLIGVRGHPVCPAPGTQGESVWFARRGEHAETRADSHSDKPDCAHEWFERHWPSTPKIELNARRIREGWARWGAEAPV